VNNATLTESYVTLTTTNGTTFDINLYIIIMPLLTILIILIIAGVLLWLVNSYIPMDGKIKTIFNIVVVVVVVVWLLKVFGIIHYITDMHV
jgi:hypothetical protein